MNQSIKLCVALRDMPADPSPEVNAWLADADALVIDPTRCTPGLFDAMPVATAVLMNGDPTRDELWREHAGPWVCERGLEATARQRDIHPELHWIPRLRVSRAQVSYRFSGPATGEGFSFYIPDTAAIKGWRVDGESLDHTLARASALGFAELWLHSPAAVTRKRGLELDLLDKTAAGPWAIWLSGGAAEAGHLRNLARAGGAAAVVVDEAMARDCTLAALRETLVRETARPAAVPLTFEPGGKELEPL